MTHFAPRGPRRPSALLALAWATSLVAVGAASAAAATQITSQQIKNATIQSVDVKNGALTGADVKDGSLASADLKNGGVAPADLAPAVAAGFYSGPIPSGVTVVGFLDEDFEIGDGVVGELRTAIELPGEPGKDLTDADVNFAPDGIAATTDDDPACTGTVASPTAPPGKLCLYTDSIAQGIAFVDTIVQYDRWPVLRIFSSGASSDVFARASWAYTAP
jgi:hypothetical protein